MRWSVFWSMIAPGLRNGEYGKKDEDRVRKVEQAQVI
jgi:hypothetical protein